MLATINVWLQMTQVPQRVWPLCQYMVNNFFFFISNAHYMQYYSCSGDLNIMMMCPSEAACLSTDRCFSELAL